MGEYAQFIITAKQEREIALRDAVHDAAMAVHNYKIQGDRFDRAQYDACLAILEGELDKACRAAEEVERG